METKIISPDDVAFTYLNELTDMLKQEPSRHPEIVGTEAILARTLRDIEGQKEHVAARRILLHYKGTALSFNEFYIGAGTKRGKRFDEVKEKLYIRAVELLGGEDVSDWFRKPYNAQDDTASLEWKIGLIVTGGAVAAPILWNIRANAITLCVWLLVVFCLGVSIVQHPSPLMRILISITATIFAGLMGLILVSILFVERL